MRRLRFEWPEGSIDWKEDEHWRHVCSDCGIECMSRVDFFTDLRTMVNNPMCMRCVLKLATRLMPVMRVK